MNKIVYDLLLKLEQCDDKHNRCDYLMEHDEITYLLEHIEEKDKEIERLNNIISIKTTYIEDLLKTILKSTDIKIQREVYEHGIEYDKKLKELKEGK